MNMDEPERPVNLETIFAGGGEREWTPREPSDTLLAEMARIRALPAGERSEALEPYLEGWHARAADPFEVAWYLAAAGLTFEEACALDDRVRSRGREELRRRARHDIICGIALLATGVLTFGYGSFVDPHFPVWGVVLLLATAAGARLLLRGIRTQRRITPLSADLLERR